MRSRPTYEGPGGDAAKRAAWTQISQMAQIQPAQPRHEPYGIQVGQQAAAVGGLVLGLDLRMRRMRHAPAGTW